jgi:hypothetical protein
VDAIDPELIDAGTLSVVTVTGSHLQGATAHIAMAKFDPGDPERVFPSAQVVAVDPAGSWAAVEIDATAAGVEGFYSLVVETPAGKAPYPFRVVPDRPVVDAWTPSESTAGDVYVMAVAGLNLAGATVELSAPGIQVIALDNRSDRLLAGLLHVTGGTLPGDVDLTVRSPGGEVIVPMLVRAGGEAVTRPTRVAQEAAEGRPQVLFQEPAALGVGGEESFASRSEAVSSVHDAADFCFNLVFSGGYTEVAVLLQLFDEVSRQPLAPSAFDRLQPGRRFDFGAQVFAVWVTVEARLVIRICDGEVSDVRVCIAVEFGFMIPFAGGQSFFFDACTGTSNSFSYGASGFLLNFEWHSSNACVQARDLDPLSPSGIRSAEVEVGDCCGETSILSVAVQGEVFDLQFGGEVPVAEVGPYCAAEQFSQFLIEVRAFIPSNYAPTLNPLDSCTTNVNGGRSLIYAGDDRGFDPNPRYKPLPPLLPESFRMLQERVLVPEQALDADGEIPEGRFAIAGQTLSYADTVIVPLVGDNRIDPDEFDWPSIRDCYHFHDHETANPDRTYDPVERLGPNKVRARMTMSGSNPLSFGSPAIDWDVSVTLEKIDADTVRYEVTAVHDCVPGYEIYINDHLVYGFLPETGADGIIPAFRYLLCLPTPPWDEEETRTGEIQLGQ